MEFGLSDKTLELINKFFSSIDDIELVKIFGSRARGNYRNSSDIDLAVWIKDSSKINRIKFELEELPLPYKFDLVDYNNIDNQNLKTSIDEDGITLYQRL